MRKLHTGMILRTGEATDLFFFFFFSIFCFCSEFLVLWHTIWICNSGLLVRLVRVDVIFTTSFSFYSIPESLFIFFFLFVLFACLLRRETSEHIIHVRPSHVNYYFASRYTYIHTFRQIYKYIFIWSYTYINMYMYYGV